jgi:hypothetical protein
MQEVLYISLWASNLILLIFYGLTPTRLSTHSIMVKFPDLSEYGYKITAEFAWDDKSSWRTYGARRLKTNRAMIVKLIPLQSDAELEAYKPQLETLIQLRHPGIPKYVHAFRIDEGLCLVRQ